MQDFNYNIPTRVYFGRDKLNNLPTEVLKYGKKVLLTYGGGSIKKTGLYDKVVSLLTSNGIEVFELGGIDPNPRTTSVDAGAKICKENNIDLVLAVGGGSTIDCSKFICASACVDHPNWDFFSKGLPVEKSLPLMTILTLSATGSEMDNGAVISNLETNEKLGKSGPTLFPVVSFLDPTLTYTVNKFQTAAGSSDIFSHIIESYFNPIDDAMFMIDSFMEGMMKTVLKYAPIALEDPTNYEARANLMWTSSWAINGMIKSCATAKWSCHPLEHELSAFYDITHGLGLAIVTPRWMEYILDETTVDRFVKFAVNVFDVENSEDKFAVAKEGIRRYSDFLFNTLGLQSTLTEINIGRENFAKMANKAVKGGVLKGFKDLTAEDVEKIFEMCL